MSSTHFHCAGWTSEIWINDVLSSEFDASVLSQDSGTILWVCWEHTGKLGHTGTVIVGQVIKVKVGQRVKILVCLIFRRKVI